VRDRDEDRLSTADMAAAGRGAILDDEQRTFTRESPDDVELRSGIVAPSDRLTPRDGSEPLFSDHEAGGFRTRWENIQTGFVDEPRHSVERADELVADAMKRLAEVFSDERARLEKQWTSGEDVSTEDLRVALQRYRSFFDRLLSV
jgi:hypothetical protein